jgi:hypothetical protein
MSIEDDNSAIQNILGVAVGQSRPHKNLTYEAFSNAIARRDKTSLLLGASKILWTLWKGEAPLKEGKMITTSGERTWEESQQLRRASVRPRAIESQSRTMNFLNLPGNF